MSSVYNPNPPLPFLLSTVRLLGIFSTAQDKVRMVHRGGKYGFAFERKRQPSQNCCAYSRFERIPNEVRRYGYQMHKFPRASSTKVHRETLTLNSLMKYLRLNTIRKFVGPTSAAGAGYSPLGSRLLCASRVQVSKVQNLFP